MEVGEHRSSCTAFWLWVVPGALLGFTVIAALSIGIFVAPFAAASVVAVSRWEARRPARGGAVGSLAGIGLVVLAIGLLHLGETQCLADGSPPAAATGCTDFDPTPWLLAGGVLVAVAMATFAVSRRA